jgi:signal transduction histidine kinase
MLAEAVPILIHDAERELSLRSPDPEQYTGGSFIGLPCMGPEGDVEILVFLYNRREGGFSEHDLAMGRIVVARVEDALRSAGLVQALEEGEVRRSLGQPQILLDQADQIFRTVRHEVGNALNTLKTTLAVLRANISSFDDPKRDEYLARCLESLRLAEQMLHALKAFQHLDQVRLERLDMPRFLSEKEGFLFSAARSRGIACSLTLNCSSAMVDADPDALLRILLNLVENSATAVSEQSDPAIMMSCHGDSGSVTVSVSDNGVGIPPEHSLRVFEPLFSTKPGGSGMGLAIVQRLAAKMDGAITLHSELHRGTSADLTLPRHGGSGCRHSVVLGLEGAT